mgnify:CR=1 FL=1
MDNFTSDRLPDSYAICLLGHGSRDPEGIEEFLILWKKLRGRKFCRITECGFLEFAKPDISEALSACRQDGIQNIIIVPGILLPGEHTHRDIPEAIRKASRNHPELGKDLSEERDIKASLFTLNKKHRGPIAENLNQ